MVISITFETLEIIVSVRHTHSKLHHLALLTFIISETVLLCVAGMIEMLRKINLSRAMRTMQELFPEEYDFYPRSWILPEEYQQFVTQV